MSTGIGSAMSTGISISKNIGIGTALVKTMTQAERIKDFCTNSTMQILLSESTSQSEQALIIVTMTPLCWEVWSQLLN